MGVDFRRAAERLGDAAGAAADLTGGAAREASNQAARAAEGAGAALSNIAEEAASAAGAAASSVAGAVVKAKDSVSERVESSEAEKRAEYKASIEGKVKALKHRRGGSLLNELGESPLPMSLDIDAKAKESFPIPREQSVLWLDAEFDLRPSGIAATEEGIYMKTDSDPFGLPSLMPAEDRAEKEPRLYFYDWDSVELGWFAGEEDNVALAVDPKCSQRFIEICKKHAAADLSPLDAGFEPNGGSNAARRIEPAALAAADSALAAEHVFIEQKAAINTPSGHGELAEEAINLGDRIHGLDAEVVGRDNSKNGADRVIYATNGPDIMVQTKYHAKARGSLEACFDPTSGQYRYMDNGEPMQLEVPKDQYQQVLEGFKIKIKQGKVPGVKDPAKANEIVREGRLTYDQAKNLAKPGNIDSLKYDAETGVVTCTFALGLTFVATAFLTWRKTRDISQSVQAGAIAGVQVFGLSFMQHMVSSQLARTSLAKGLVAPTEALVGRLGSNATKTIVNGLRALSGRGAIYGAAATKHLAKALRSNVLTGTITMIVFSAPDTYKLVNRRLSFAQYTKNIASLAGSVAGGAAGAVGAGVAAAKVAGAAGTAVAPGVGTAVGIAGGIVGGTVGSLAVDKVGGILHEDDLVIVGRYFNAMITWLSSQYFLDEDELELLVSKLDETNANELKGLFESFMQNEAQEDLIRGYLEPIFDDTVSGRQKFLLPTDEDIAKALEEAANAAADE